MPAAKAGKRTDECTDANNLDRIYGRSSVCMVATISVGPPGWMLRNSQGQLPLVTFQNSRDRVDADECSTRKQRLNTASKFYAS